MEPRQPPEPPSLRRATGRRGFTLVEAAMVMVIIGVGVMAMLELLAAGTAANGDAARLATAITLADNAREMSVALAYQDPQMPGVWDTRESSVTQYDNVMDLDGPVDTWDKPEEATGWQKFSPPRDGTRKSIDLPGKWAQYIKVETVSSDNITTLLPHDPNCEVVRVTVKVTRGDIEVYRTSWIVTSAPK